MIDLQYMYVNVFLRMKQTCFSFSVYFISNPEMNHKILEYITSSRVSILENDKHPKWVYSSTQLLFYHRFPFDTYILNI